MRVEELEPCALLATSPLVGGFPADPGAAQVGSNFSAVPGQTPFQPATAVPTSGATAAGFGSGTTTGPTTGTTAAPGQTPLGQLLGSVSVSAAAVGNGPVLTNGLAPGVTATLGQPLFGQAFAGLPAGGTPFAGPALAVVLTQGSGLPPGQISFSQLAIPGSQASPMAQLPPVPFPYITGPVAPAPGPANTIPTFAVDVARVNQGVGGPAGNPTADNATGTQRTQQSPTPRQVSVPFFSILFEPAEGSDDPGVGRPATDSTPDVPPAEETSWGEMSTAYFAAAQAQPARPDLPGLPLSLDQAEAPPASALLGLVVALGGASWWPDGSAQRRTPAKRRRGTTLWVTPI